MSVAREVDMYGMTKENLDSMIANSFYRIAGGLEMLAMSMMSDAQEMIAYGTVTTNLLNEQRQLLNCAKYVLSVVMRERMEEEV